MRLPLLLLTSLCLAACGEPPVTPPITPPDMAGPIDPTNPGGDCPELTGAGTQHAGFITADETWTAADSPHVVMSELSVRGATLTIEPCAVVVLAEGVNFVVGDNSGSSAAL